MAGSGVDDYSKRRVGRKRIINLIARRDIIGYYAFYKHHAQLTLCLVFGKWECRKFSGTFPDVFFLWGVRCFVTVGVMFYWVFVWKTNVGDYKRNWFSIFN